MPKVLSILPNLAGKRDSYKINKTRCEYCVSEQRNGQDIAFLFDIKFSALDP